MHEAQFPSDPECEEEQRRPSETLAHHLTRRSVLGAAVMAGAGAALTAAYPEELLAQAVGPEIAQDRQSRSVQVLLNINGEAQTFQLEPRVTLLDAIREYAGMFGTKKGCDHGQCGACTVLVNGERINSCLTLAVMHQHARIVTVEGLASGDELHPLQQAFIDQDAFQCGYCTPGQLCSAVGLLQEGRVTTEDEIREGMAGNLCRCGAYPNIVKAIQTVMRKS